ncbi:zinc finger protein 878-like [Zerene cesonia]|uniref:zinc finger protein 878-like n=1 Tax=Zerene cesonia TaxID=33412 RepID=UPI0018E5816F|nr:zinc finger protein 878-like [Zerene cesonia]
MASLNICRVCLRTYSKSYNFDQFQLKSHYEAVLGLKVNDEDGLPKFFCYECASLLQKFHKFKEKCHKGQEVLKEMQSRGFITYKAVNSLDRELLQLSSPFKEYIYEGWGITDKIEYIDNIVLEFEDSTDNLDMAIENIQVEKVENITDNELDFCEQMDTDNIMYDTKDQFEIKIEDEKKKNKCITKTSLLYDNVNWRVINLTEDEAIKEFRLRSEDPKYITAAYKCKDCLKGFCRQDMLKRHMDFLHSASKGALACRFCNARVKYPCHLRNHMRDHYTKYECLRCRVVCMTEKSALHHEDSHSGVTRKCIYCNEEFRHSSTYYTHLRTHRSDHVCTACGESFVSEVGLHMHRRAKHRDNADSPGDEDANTFCARCDKNFDTRRAYEEHFFHTAVHADELLDLEMPKSEEPRKIRGKRMQEKIINQLNNRDTDDVKLKPNAENRKWRRRKIKKPTTCHQCGKSFETQAACMKHHLKTHPRTSFFAPSERHICEICGASLAPGSVATHQNMHSKEKMHPCGTCGRQFYSSVSHKRHLLTHTGEKPYQCTQCEKRFTQSNSMKLHFRTAHLKQPYPKRNRRKKKEEKTENTAQETCSEESDAGKELHQTATGIEPAYSL